MLRSLLPWRERSRVPASEMFPDIGTRFDESLEDFVDRFWGENGGWLSKRGAFMPTTDVSEDEKAFEVKVDLPGLKPEEVHVELKNGDLWISGKREEEKEEKGKTYHRIERRHGEFRRVLPLPSAIREEEIEAKFEHGVLKVTVPKTEEAKAKHIEIKA